VNAELLYRLSRLLPPCPLRTFADIPCPTCGTTRAVLALARGDVWGAICMNPLVTLGGGALLLYILVGLFVQKKTGRFPEPEWTPRRLWILRAVVLGALIANWGYLYRSGI
jgi:ribosomal protein S27E